MPSAGAGAAPVTIKQVEVEIIDRGYAAGHVTPQVPDAHSGRTVAVVGSGPAGLAAAQQLVRAGHAVTVYERDAQPGGLLRYGIPDFKLEKIHVERRVAQLSSAEGVEFRTGVDIGRDVTVAGLRDEHDAVLLACGALDGRDMPETPGRDLAGVHLAMEHLVAANKVIAGEAASTPIDAAGKHVIIIGGGDTAADCLGVAHRQGAGERHPTRHLSEPAGRARTPGATRGRRGPGCCVATRPTKRVASGCSRSSSAGSSRPTTMAGESAAYGSTR